MTGDLISRSALLAELSARLSIVERVGVEEIVMGVPAVCENVYPDWYERLSRLEFEYDPVKNGEPWYRAEDVWACIEEVAE